MPPAPVLLGSPRCIWDAHATLGEGVCWSVREQALYWVDILEQRLYRYAPATGRRGEWRLSDTVSAVAERKAQGGLAVTLRRGLCLFDPATGAQQRLHEPEPERSNNRFNDGKCDAQGRFWAGSMDFDAQAPTGALYRFDKNGQGVRVADLGWPVTNGPTWSLDQRTLFLNDTVNAEVFAFDFDPASGAVSHQRPWLRFAADDGYPDGMTTDAAGRIWIAHWGGACVTCHDPGDARELARVTLPTARITNVAFGGVSLSTLFITSARVGLSDERLAAEPLAGALFAVNTDAIGQPAHLYAG